MALPINAKYLDEYKKNETDANRVMSLANAFAAAVMAVIWFLYIFRVFPLQPNLYILVNIIFPIDIFILVFPLFFIKTPRLEKPTYKYFLIFSFIMVVTVLNVVLPKHGLLGWALCIVMVNHYYNPKLGKIVFATVLVCLLGAMYASMFLGEYDPYLLDSGIVGGKVVYPINEAGNYYLPNSPAERWEMLSKMMEMGENRFLKAFLFYYVARAALLIILFIVSDALNRRTYRLLSNEIKVNSQQEKISTELNVAKTIQLSTLPRDFVTNEDVEIMAELKAAKEVGGDFYDYINLEDGHIAILIGDVSDKGVPAAMFMMKTITCFKNFISAKKKPSEIMKEVNRAIYEGNENQMFVTCFLAIIDTKTGLMRFANAGHNPPILGKNFHYRYLKCSAGFILGGMPDAYCVDEECQLENGDIITLYTDGITEARDKSGAFYGEKRLLDLYNSRDFTCITHLHHELKDDVAKFVQDAEQSDDMTFLTLKYHGDEYYYSELLLPGVKENLPQMLEFVKGFAVDKDLPESFTRNLLVVADELISNIVKYGYKEKEGDVFIRLLYNVPQKVFVMTLIDTGTPFNQLAVNKGPLTGKAEEQQEGGLGILIVKNVMSEYAYDFVNDKNIITLRKKLD